MKQSSLRIIAAAALLLSLLLSGGALSPEQANRDGTENGSAALTTLGNAWATDASLGTLQCLYYDPARFAHSVAAAEPYDISGTLIGGVVPHHLIADRQIASFFHSAALQKEDYDTVVLIGPNHSGSGGAALTCLYDFQTPFGLLSCDTAATKRLLGDSRLPVAANPQLIEADHALSSLIPYVKYYLPEAKVVCLLLTREFSQQDAAHLASTLAGSKRSLIVGSVDFSHYLTPEEAAIKDQQTWEAIQARDLDTIAEYRDDHLDSPGTILTLLQYSDLHGANIELLERSEASALENAPLTDGTTSHLILAITKPDAPPK